LPVHACDLKRSWLHAVAVLLGMVSLILMLTGTTTAVPMAPVNAAASQPPTSERMWRGGKRVFVQYVCPASAEDLKLPFYPEARLERSFAYTVSDRQGRQIAYYATASLVSSDRPERAADRYCAQLPGLSEAELIEDASGKRYVLAAADGRETRQVTVRPHRSGCHIELIRTLRPVPVIEPRPGGETETAA
jgi:hypothetical protein